MPIKSIERRTSVLGYASPDMCPIYVKNTDNIVRVIPAGSGTTEVQLVDASSAQTLTNKTLTGPVVGGQILAPDADGTHPSYSFSAETTTGLYRQLPGVIGVSGSLNISGKITSYNGITTAGIGAPVIVASGTQLAKVAAVASVAAYTVGAADGTFEVSANVNVTTATTHAFTVTCAYTDETNTSRTLTMTFGLVAGGVTTTSIANANGTVPYMGITQTIRCKTATTITIATTGTFTTVAYNAFGYIKQIA